MHITFTHPASLGILTKLNTSMTRIRFQTRTHSDSILETSVRPSRAKSVKTNAIDNAGILKSVRLLAGLVHGGVFTARAAEPQQRRLRETRFGFSGLHPSNPSDARGQLYLIPHLDGNSVGVGEGWTGETR